MPPEARTAISCDMPNLKTLLSDLERQLQDALAARTPPQDSAVQLRPERVTLQLKLKLAHEGSPIQLLPITAEDHARPGSVVEQILTVEYWVGPRGTLDASPAVSIHSTPSNEVVSTAALAPAVPIPTDDRALAVLTEILGPPGFDSSARASVFCEAVSELDESQRVAIWNALADPRPGVVIDPQLKRARHLLRGVLRSKTGGSVSDGPTALAALFTSHRSEDLLQLIQSHWKTQADWL